MWETILLDIYIKRLLVNEIEILRGKGFGQ